MKNTLCPGCRLQRIQHNREIIRDIPRKRRRPYLFIQELFNILDIPEYLDN